MNTPPDLLSHPETDWQQWTRAALEAYREGDWIQLAQSPLAASALAEECLLSGEPCDLMARGRALAAVLAWGVDKLKPGGTHSWTARPWRAYNVLYYGYLQGMSVSDQAEKIGVVDQTIYDNRPGAFEALATILRHELKNPQDRAGRKRTYLAARYAARSPDEQTLLRVAAIFRQAAPVKLLMELAALQTPDVWGELLADGLLLSDEEHITLLAHPELRPYLLTLLTPRERFTWHVAAAMYYQNRSDYLEATLHFRQAAAHEKAAAILITQKTWFQAQHREPLRDLLREFQATEVSPHTWAQLKLLSGDVAEALLDMDTALAEYGQALAAPAPAIKSEAYYRRARVLKLRNAAEALAHYETCLQILETTQPESPLLAQAALDIAWIYIESGTDWELAEQRLQQAQVHIPGDAAGLRARLHNTWGEWWYQQRKSERSLAEFHRARVAALEAQDVEMQLNAAYNLGIQYAETGQLPSALGYLQEGRALAIQVGDRHREGRCDKGIGEYYFWLGDYREAVHYYTAAHAIFAEMNNQLWQTAACYDLTEAHAELGEWDKAWQYFRTGTALVQELGVEWRKEAFRNLAKQYPPLLGEDLTDRQRQILAHMQTTGALSSQACAELLDLSKESALRELKTLLQRGLIVKQGSGRATCYVLP